MQRTKIIALVLLFGCAILAAPFHAAAQDIDVSPTSWDFGDIEVGSSATVDITLTSAAWQPLTINSVSITDDASGSFSIISDAPPPAISLYLNEFIHVTVEYTPTGPGGHTASMRIDSNAESPDNIFYVPLQGVGVPGSTIEDIQDFFDDSVEGGTLEGIGPGDSANGRLNALRNMLEMAGDLISIGDIEGACVQLDAALGKCDGDPLPPDFVLGEAVSELSSMILELMEELGCE